MIPSLIWKPCESVQLRGRLGGEMNFETKNRDLIAGFDAHWFPIKDSEDLRLHFAAGYHHRYSQSVSYQFVSKRNGYLIMNHLYYYEPRSAESRVIIKATDPYGTTYTASSNDAVTEPFFNFAHFYASLKKK